MEANAFASLANIPLPSPSRLLASSCCPDKDLVVLVTRLGGQDRMSLWKIQGTKTWEVEVSSNGTQSEHIIDLSWSPDGQSIAVAHDPPCISLHSVQDGHEERVLSFGVSKEPAYSLTSLWWFRQEKKINSSSIPDIFKRNDIVTGTAHSILKSLPLLDNIQEESQKLTATDLFAFQGSQTRTVRKSSLPDVIKGWPTLQTDHLLASMSSPSHGSYVDPIGVVVDEKDDTNLDSILAAADSHGRIHSFLDGTYPLGHVTPGRDLSITSLHKDPQKPSFFAQLQSSSDAGTLTDLKPTFIRLSLLEQRKVRDIARLSSSARELVWYTVRVVKEMRAVWFGSETLGGAREFGPKWVQALEAKQKEQFGQEEPSSLLDLTSLLVTGHASEALADFLGSDEQMSERGIQKWESTVTEALAKLRDFSEKRVAPACQRLHLILEELQGWSTLPQNALFDLNTDPTAALHLTGRVITLASWLAAVARRELSRFKEFIAWVRFESVVNNPTTETTPPVRHDILEVNKYLMSGLVVSSIDKWFMGPVPQFKESDLGLPGIQPLREVIDLAKAAVNDPNQVRWQHNVKPTDLNHLDRNIDALVQELVGRCRTLFDRASGAAGRSAVITSGHDSIGSEANNARPYPQASRGLFIRERIITDTNKDGDFLQYLALHLPLASEQRSLLCLMRQRYMKNASSATHVGVVLLECCLPLEAEESVVDLDLLEAEFFDDECVVIVYRLPSQGDGTFIATANYNDLGYQELQPQGYVNVPPREELMQQAVESWKAGHLPSVRIPIKRCRALVGCKTGGVSLAVNGRVGRRVACVLDSKGITMETLDLEGYGEDMEVESGELEVEGDDGERG